MYTPSLSDDFQRLESLRHADAGFYAVALHAFIESAAAEYGGLPPGTSFETILKACLQNREASSRDAPDAPESETNLEKLAAALLREHNFINGIRRGFARWSIEESRCATWHFLRLGRITGWWQPAEAAPLEASLDPWYGRQPGDADEALARLKDETAASGIRAAEILLQHDQSGTIDLRGYAEGLGRLTHVSRTHREFEQSAARLSPEQQSALDQFTAEQDMLITGGAGTGKTRVLLEALARTLDRNSPELDMGQPTATALVTFTKTLVKYNRYLAALLTSGGVMENNLESSETFFWKKLRLKEPKHTVDYNLLRNMVSELNTTGVLSDAELYIEIEEFLFGWNIKRDEYLDATVPRRGLKTPLNLSDREKVWAIREEIEERMLSESVYSKLFARLRLLYWLETQAEGLVTHDSLFIDESQDMSAIELICLKRLAGRSLIMAGDTGQSIYGFVNPYRRAGLHLHQDHIRLLNTNHRNSIPIHRMAEDYRQAGLAPGEDPGPESFPFREGPEPEIHQREQSEPLADLLVAKAQLYIRDLGYSPEDIGILCSRTAHLTMMSEKLGAVGLESATIKNTSFEFQRRESVRLSTLHSSKGLDFPVVLMYVPELPPAREIDPPYQDRLHRNLQYVAMSRGMDAVERFEREGEDA